MWGLRRLKVDRSNQRISFLTFASKSTVLSTCSRLQGLTFSRSKVDFSFVQPLPWSPYETEFDRDSLKLKSEIKIPFLFQSGANR
jgi:hypothetical protein